MSSSCRWNLTEGWIEERRAEACCATATVTFYEFWYFSFVNFGAPVFPEAGRGSGPAILSSNASPAGAGMVPGRQSALWRWGHDDRKSEIPGSQ
jgi:hypothetical protein